MRIVLVGAPGAGKTTLGQRLAQALDIPLIELDAINFLPGWHELVKQDTDELLRRTSAAIAGQDWICDGGHNLVRPLVWSRATHLIWLDYGKFAILRRIVRRSVYRTISRRELWPGTGNRETIRDWLNPSHPIQWAWRDLANRRREIEAILRRPDHAHVKVLRLHHPWQAGRVLKWLGD